MPIDPSASRFAVLYRIAGSETDARARAEDITLEDTVELPLELVPEGPIRSDVIGRIEEFHTAGNDCYEALISYEAETTAFELTQLLNVVFGNVSIKPGIRVERIILNEDLLARFKGPRFGIGGWRERLRVENRPLLCSALKPMGLNAMECADLARQLALGGIDIIKDDHGLTNQSYAAYEDRVSLCSEAVRLANAETGFHCAYMANVTAPADEILTRAMIAKRSGAGGLLAAPGLIGYDAVRVLSENAAVDLPIMCHPSFQGSFVIHPSFGVSHAALFGQMARLAGADATIFPNWGGRFSFSAEECLSIAEACKEPMGSMRPIFPTPAGGMGLDRLNEMSAAYGGDVIFLIGAGLFRHSDNLIASAKMLKETVEKFFRDRR